MHLRTLIPALGLLIAGFGPLSSLATQAQDVVGSGADVFAQLGQELPTPNSYRTASGAPGHEYWQQQADYDIDARLDADARRIDASARIVYTNNSPDALRYLWLQLDQNRFKQDSLDRRSRTESSDEVSYSSLREHQAVSIGDYGYRNLRFSGESGEELPFIVVDTMVRVDLPKPLASGEYISFNLEWTFDIIERDTVRSRGGYEQFYESDTQIFFLSQWFPRLAVYSDYDGWHNKAFLGRGEFTLEFGDYDVSLTVPENHIISSTGALANPDDVLTAVQKERLAKAGSDKPIFVVTPQEALANEKSKATGTRTWRFEAENVRDFAWASSSKFIWDAMVHEQPGAKHERVYAMSFYPNEAEPVWSKYSTQAVVHTMDVYSRFSFDYPYPTAQSVNTWEGGGMEYPMITFNGYRPDPPRADPEDPESAESRAAAELAYSRRIKYGLIGVVIHEVGHIYFPMVVNSDERQWTWMDEGLNTFLEYVAELEWEEDFPAFRRISDPLVNEINVLDMIPEYMMSPNQVPIMTQSDSVLRLGPNAYSKPAAALTVLRETVMGRELFDFAFREYAQRWKFKRPTPADFFRTMEDASGVDLDWFWRSWFYTTDYVDMAITDVRAYRLKHDDPDVDYPLDRKEHARDNPLPVNIARNQAEGIVPREERFEALKDLYSENDRYTVTNKDRNDAADKFDQLEPWEQRAFTKALKDNNVFYFVDFENLGGVPSPLMLHIKYEDGSERELEIPAEIWRRDALKVTHRLIEDKPIAYISLDPRHQTADANYSNNRFPSAIHQSRLSAYKADVVKRNLMADMLHELKDSAKMDSDNGKSAPLKPANGR
ncbi:M1 family metallopeptidase [Congregibacter sp.]|nr:M1 family metallopeptidase [Congregibacter sp.]MDA8962340.1 M1 family metallopeptidase [Congregibacter sp.]